MSIVEIFRLKEKARKEDSTWRATLVSKTGTEISHEEEWEKDIDTWIEENTAM